MNADGMPSLWVQTVCVYSVRGLLGSDASDWSARRTQHAAAQKERIRLAAGKDRMSHACPILPLSLTIERTWNLRFYWTANTPSHMQFSSRHPSGKIASYCGA